MRLSGDRVRNAFDEYLDALEDDAQFEEEPVRQEFLAEKPDIENPGTTRIRLKTGRHKKAR